MPVDNEDRNSVVTTDPNGRRISPDARLIAEKLTRGFDQLKKEMDNNEKSTERKTEREDKAVVWMILILGDLEKFSFSARFVDSW